MFVHSDLPKNAIMLFSFYRQNSSIWAPMFFFSDAKSFNLVQCTFVWILVLVPEVYVVICKHIQFRSVQHKNKVTFSCCIIVSCMLIEEDNEVQWLWLICVELLYNISSILFSSKLAFGNAEKRKSLGYSTCAHVVIPWIEIGKDLCWVSKYNHGSLDFSLH